MNKLVPSLVGVLALALSAPTQTLQLKNGAVLIGEVQQAHEDGLTFLRLDNGGTLELRWSHLSTECAVRIKELFNLAVDEGDEVTVTADQITYEISGVTHVVLGKLVDRTPTDIIVQRKGLRIPVPRSSIVVLREVQVPASEIFTVEEFYSGKLIEFAPGDDADKHLLLATELMRVRDYENAERHLLQARDLGNSRQPNAILGKLERLRRYRDAEDERDLLDQISVQRFRKNFDRGLELIARFEKEYPDSSLMTEFERETQRFEGARSRFLIARVNETWKRLIRTVAEREVAERGVTFEIAKNYAERQMGDDIAERVGEILGLEAEDVKDLWAKRTDTPGLPRREHFSYGIGSWVLGRSGVIKDTVKGEEEDPVRRASEDRDIERTARRIRQMQERAGRSLGGRRAQANRTSEEEWWQQADRNEKAGWLRAYYAEHGGDLILYRAYTLSCVNCAGSGSVEHLGTTGRTIQAECFVCHGTRFVRTLRVY